MPLHNYTAYTATGEIRRGQIEADHFAAAAARLQSEGLFPETIKEAHQPSATSGGFLCWRAAVPPREHAAFLRQLATLLQSAVPLLRALEVLAKQEPHRTMRALLQDLATEIRHGASLSAALARHPHVFDSLCLGMVRAGEAAGALDTVLERLATLAEKRLNARARLRAALTYPCVVLVVAVSILTGLLVFVVPKFEQIFADLLHGAALPPLTQAVISLSRGVQMHAGLLGLGGVLLVVIASGLRKTDRGRRATDAILLKLPIVGGLSRRAFTARFARTLGTLVAGGVPILDALRLAADTAGNTRVAKAVQVVHDGVRAGGGLAHPLETTGIFPPLLGGMCEVGEQTGRLPEMLTRAADILDAEVDAAVAGLGSLLEPALIVFLAVTVGTVVVALFLPVIRIVQLLG